jgi:hypothetical protein
MRRRSSKTNQIILWIISLLVIAGMLCGVLASIFAPDYAASLLPGLAVGMAWL